LSRLGSGRGRDRAVCSGLFLPASGRYMNHHREQWGADGARSAGTVKQSRHLRAGPGIFGGMETDFSQPQSFPPPARTWRGGDEYFFREDGRERFVVRSLRSEVSDNFRVITDEKFRILG
jgi:hypothetical protein